VHWGLGCNVIERVRSVALCDGLRRNLSRNYFAKQAITHVL
jgi:hypothetical protein